MVLMNFLVGMNGIEDTFTTKTPYKIKFTISQIIKKLNLSRENNRYLSFAAKLNYFFKFISVDPLSQTIIWQSSYQNFDKRKLKLFLMK